MTATFAIQKTSSSPSITPHLPLDTQAEQIVLQGMMLYPIIALQSSTVLKPIHFVDPTHRLIFEGATTYLQTNPGVFTIDTDALLFLFAPERREVVGAIISTFFRLHIHTEEACQRAIEEVAARAALRGIHLYATRWAEQATQTPATYADLLQFTASMRTQIQSMQERIGQIVGTHNEQQLSMLNAWIDLNDNPPLTANLGIPQIDEIMGAMQVGNLVAIAGLPGSGKTAFLTRCLVHAIWGVTNQVPQHPPTTPVLLYSYEISAPEYLDRIAAWVLGVEYSRIRTHRDHYAESLVNLAGVLSDPSLTAPFLIVTPKERSLDAFCDDLRQRVLSTAPRPQIVMLDYFQLLTLQSSMGASNNHEQMQRLKDLCIELNIILITVSSVSSSVNRKGGLYGGGEYALDYILKLTRGEDVPMGHIRVAISKSRYGQIVIPGIDLPWDPTNSRLAGDKELADIVRSQWARNAELPA